MTDRISYTRTRNLIRATLFLGMLWLLSACGGGLGGSGDGGKEPGVVIVTPPSDATSPDYQFQHVPESLLAEFPASLTRNADRSASADDSPYTKLASTSRFIINRKLDIGLLLLSLESNWDSIVAHCETTPNDSYCDLTDAGISSTYTTEMAAWVSDLHIAIEKERTGTVGSLPAQTLIDIEEKVRLETEKTLSIDGGSFKTLSQGNDYQYEALLTSSAGSYSRAFKVRWSEDKDLTSMTLAKVDGEELVSLQSSIDYQTPADGLNNTILVTSKRAGLRRERQLNLHQPLNDKGLHVESHLTEFDNSSKLDYYSIGRATEDGGYLSSEKAAIDAADLRVADFFRESFSGDAQIEALSVCRQRHSERLCDLENAWEHHSPQSPTLSTYFLTPEQLDSLEARLTPFDLSISGISRSADTLVLLKRENFRVSFSRAGVVVKLAGLGQFDLHNYSLTQAIDDVANSPEQLKAYADSVLCRVNKNRMHESTSFHSFCAGSVSDIENAVIVSETFRDGHLGMQWHANSSIEVLQQ